MRTILAKSLMAAVFLCGLATIWLVVFAKDKPPQVVYSPDSRATSDAPAEAGLPPFVRSEDILDYAEADYSHAILCLDYCGPQKGVPLRSLGVTVHQFPNFLSELLRIQRHMVKSATAWAWAVPGGGL